MPRRVIGLDRQLRIHNLICLEKKLHEEGRTGDAFTIRQVLDMIKPSWRKEAIA